MANYRHLPWRCHTPNLLREVLHNPGTGMLARPLELFAQILGEVADRAVELNDDKLNALMIRLTLYEQADPDSASYDREGCEAILQRNGYGIGVVASAGAGG